MPLPLSIITSVETCTGHRLLDYHGKCAHLHGHNYRWEVEVGFHKPLVNPDYGIAIDFTLLKDLVKDLLEPLDHAMVLRLDDPAIPFLQSTKQRAVFFSCNPTAENLAAWLAWRVYLRLESAAELDPRDYTVWVTCHETSKCFVRVSAAPTEMREMEP